MRKGEIAYYKQFLLISQCILQLYILSVSKCGIVWKGQTFFPAYFHLSPLTHVRKVFGGFGEKARKHICVTNRHDMALAFKVALYSKTNNHSMCFNTIINIIPVISLQPVYVTMLSWNSFHQYSIQYPFKATGCFPT